MKVLLYFLAISFFILEIFVPQEMKWNMYVNGMLNLILAKVYDNF